MYHAQLRWQPIAVLLALAIIWGAGMAIIKIGSRELAPLFMAGLRSLVASACLCIWMKARGQTLFPSKIVVLHGVVIGLLFGAEFGLIYVGLEYTLTSRVAILLYTAPFFVALQAHFLLPGDRLNSWKAAGLLLAFGGVVILFVDDWGDFYLKALPGDLMALAAAVFWGSTTVYIKKFLVDRASSLQTLFYQVLFSAPLLFALSVALEDPLVSELSWAGGLSVFYPQLSGLVRTHQPLSCQPAACVYLFYACIWCLAERYYHHGRTDQPQPDCGPNYGVPGHDPGQPPLGRGIRDTSRIMTLKKQNLRFCSTREAHRPNGRGF